MHAIKGGRAHSYAPPPPPPLPPPFTFMSMMPAPLDPRAVDVCYYHGNCMDGACAAALVKRVAPARCRFVPCWWDTPEASQVVGKNVLFVDITPTPAALDAVIRVAAKVFVIDHHVSGRDTLLSRLAPTQYLFDMRECGATLTWHWLVSAGATHTTVTPPILPYVKAQDLFDWRALEAAGELDAVRLCRCIEVKTEPTVARFEAVLAEGQAFLDRIRVEMPVADEIVEHQVNRVLSSVEYATLAACPDVRVAVVNTQTFVNYIAHRLYSNKAQHVDVVWVWYHHGPTGRVRVMLRSCGRFDCNSYAVCRGGGGHVNSANFVCDAGAMRALLKSTARQRVAPGT